MSHLLVTNDFPPKIGGIQTYLWELWRRLPAGEAVVLTTSHPDAAAWDAAQPFRIHRVRERVLLPRRSLVQRIRGLVAATGAKLVVLDPALPLGLIGPHLDVPYVVVLHGAEVAVVGRLPATRRLLGRVLSGASGLVAAGGYPEAEAVRAVGGPARLPEVVRVPPGVDPDRFRPLDDAARRAARSRLGLPPEGPLIMSASRLVPRKGMDVLIEAMTRLVPHRPGLTLAVAGDGRDASRLRVIAGRHAIKVRFLGRVPEDDLADVYGVGDVFAMICRDRWGGLEQEGFGIVFLEAAACGVPQVAGWSGGAAEAVADRETGLVVRDPTNPAAVAEAVGSLLDDPDLRRRLGTAARRRAEESFSWDGLSATLLDALGRWTP